MDTATYLQAISATGINAISVQWTTDTKPAAKHAARRLRKVTTAMAMTGVEYRNLAAVTHEPGPLQWGEWSMYPYLISHKGQDYARLYTVDGTVRTKYYVDDVEVDRKAFLAFLTPSVAKKKAPHAGTVTLRLDNVQVVGAPGLVAVS